MKCHQCQHKCRVKFSKDGKTYCSSTCMGVEPKQQKAKRFGGFAVQEDKFVFVDAGSDDMMMPVHYELEDATPEKIEKRHKEKLRTHNTRNALKREFAELRGDK